MASLRLRAAACLLLASASSLTWACRCVEPGPTAAYRTAQGVVHVSVLAVSGDAEGPGGATASLSVQLAWKADAAQTIEVHTSTTCAYLFQPGREYLVYLRQTAGSTAYTTRRCMGNKPIEQAKAQLDWLRSKATAKQVLTPR